MTPVQLVQALYHDPNATAGDAEGECIPRIRLDCSGCRQKFDFCHVSPAVIREYVDPKLPPWRCSACRVGGRA